MTPFTIPDKLTACVFALLCFASIGQASPPLAEQEVHFCLPLTLEDMRARDSLYAARKHALNLNVGEPRTVRMIYFLPNDRPYRTEIVQKMKDEIRNIQTFYRDQMRAHGHGDMTFRFETDAQGEPLVHRVDGQHPDSHYLDETFNAVISEVDQAFDKTQNIYFIVIDNSIDVIGSVRATGRGGAEGKNGGIVLVPGGFSWQTTAHELGHAFGLEHDFRDDAYIMSYGPGEDQLSACHAEFLSIHPYFNPDISNEEAPPPTIELISPTEYSEGSTSVSIQLRVRDPDGLHQAILFVSTREPHFAAGYLEVKACRGLNSERDTVIQFDYDGVTPSSGPSLSNPLFHPNQFFVSAIDTDGNVREKSFSLRNMRDVIATLEGHASTVASVAFSPDGTTLASGAVAYDGKVKLWDVATQTNIATLETQEHQGGIFSLSFSPDGSTLASNSYETVALWDVIKKMNIATFEHTSTVTSVAFSPNGTILALGTIDGMIALWDVAMRTNIATLEGHTGEVKVAFSPGGTLLASGAEDGTVKLWDVATLKNVATLEEHTSYISSITFSSDGTMLASGAGDNTVKLWDVAMRTNVATLEHTQYAHVLSVAFSPDGTLLASGATDDVVKLWDVATRTNIATLYHLNNVYSVAFSPDGSILASGTDNDGVIKLWDMSEWMQPRPQTLVKVSGDNRQGTPGEALTNPFVVEVRDQYGNPLPDARVAFTVTAGNGKLSGRFTTESTTTDANGRAQSTLTLGPNPGTNIVEASVSMIKTTFNAVGIGTTTVPVTEGNYQTWHLPDGALTRLGKGRMSDRDRAIAFSPDGQLFAVASAIGIYLYDVATSRERTLLTGHDGAVQAVAFSPHGTTLASGAYDNTVKLWDVATRTEITTLEGTSQINSIAFSPDGTLLVAGSVDGRVELWDIETRIITATLEGHTEVVFSVAFSPDSATLASGSNDGTVKLWDMATKRNIATLEVQIQVNSVAFSPDGTTLAAASWNRTVKLWDVETLTDTATLKHRSVVNSVAFSPDGATLVSTSFREVKLWDVKTKKIIAILEHTNWVYSAAYSPDGTTLAAGAQDGTIKLWDVATQNLVILRHTRLVESVAFSPDGSTLAVGRYLWDVETRRNITTLERSLDFVTFAPDGTTLASGLGWKVRLWDIATGENVATLEGHAGGVNSIAYSPDGTTLASGSADYTIKLWDVSTRTNTATLAGHTDRVNSVAFSPDGSTLASGAWDNTVRLWNVLTRTTTATLEGHGSQVFSVAFSPDGTVLASGGYGDRSVKLWDVATRTEIVSIEHLNPVTFVVFSPDGTALASGSDDGKVKLWNVEMEREVATLAGHTDRVNSVAFSPDGSTLASGSWDGTVLLWDMSPYITSQFLMSDFDGDRHVGFPDFLLFVAQFGLSQTDEAYDARFDLDGDGAIGFGDFLVFANHFGKAVASPGSSGG